MSARIHPEIDIDIIQRHRRHGERAHRQLLKYAHVCNDEKFTHLSNIAKYGVVVFPYHYYLLVYTTTLWTDNDWFTRS